eukprot:scaffold10724_cov150-Isochrysis_galbana.AAC.2
MRHRLETAWHDAGATLARGRCARSCAPGAQVACETLDSADNRARQRGACIAATQGVRPWPRRRRRRAQYRRSAHEMDLMLSLYDYSVAPTITAPFHSAAAPVSMHGSSGRYEMAVPPPTVPNGCGIGGRFGFGYGYGCYGAGPLVMPRNELPTPPPLAYAALIAAQDTELAAARMELQEAERAERMQCATSMAEAAHTAQEAARAARMRLGLATATVHSRSFM